MKLTTKNQEREIKRLKKRFGANYVENYFHYLFPKKPYGEMNLIDAQVLIHSLKKHERMFESK